MKFLSLILISALLTACGDSYLNNLPTNEQIEQTIDKGEFSEAKRLIRLALAYDSLTPAQRWDLNFRIEIYILRLLRERCRWEKSNALEKFGY